MEALMKQFGGGAGGAGGMPDFGDDDDEGDEEAGEKVGLPSISHTKPEIATDRRPLHFAIPDARARGGLRVQVKDAHDIGKLKRKSPHQAISLSYISSIPSAPPSVVPRAHATLDCPFDRLVDILLVSVHAIKNHPLGPFVLRTSQHNLGHGLPADPAQLRPADLDALSGLVGETAGANDRKPQGLAAIQLLIGHPFVLHVRRMRSESALESSLYQLGAGLDVSRRSVAETMISR